MQKTDCTLGVRVVAGEMRSIVARGVNFGMAVAYTISAKQRAIETVASMDISHSDICLNTPDLLRFVVLR